MIENKDKYVDKDATTLYQTMPCSPFEVESFCALNNADPFHESVLDNLKKLLPKGEEDIKQFSER